MEQNVATREGGVDRNYTRLIPIGKDGLSPPARVAWIETAMKQTKSACSTSPPARVAWIETFRSCSGTSLMVVATREGGVDRNLFCKNMSGTKRCVATREGGVDRNDLYMAEPA